MRDIYTRLMATPLGISPASDAPREPQLGVLWETRRGSFASSLRALFGGPRPAREFPRPAYFNANWVLAKFPARAFVASVVCHILLFVTPWPGWSGGERPANIAEAASPRYGLTWETPARDLPAVTPPAAKKPSVSSEINKVLAARGADAFHPRQTIISAPKVPTHPRQTLLQPDAPPVAPKILPQLPNIVQWAAAPQPVRPRLQISRETLARLRPKERRTRPLPEAALPEVPNAELHAGDLNIAAVGTPVKHPLLPVIPISTPRLGPSRDGRANAEAPVLNPNLNPNDSGARRIIALSPAPGADLKAPVPEGNLQARLSISPEGTQPGTPGGTANNSAGANENSAGAGGNGKGLRVPGISITGGNPNAISSVAALGNGTGVGRISPGTPAPHPAAPDPTRTPPSPGFERLKPGMPPEAIFDTRRIYTLHVNMPNLTSVTGSWILSFVEMRGEDDPADPPPKTPSKNVSDLTGPVPLRKVDPKYPPALAEARVQGEVVLYAIIRKDGSVDSIQLVRGLDPNLDQNAMKALARWQFRPAERRGAPIELEAIVHIPFRSVAPNY